MPNLEPPDLTPDEIIVAFQRHILDSLQWPAFATPFVILAFGAMAAIRHELSPWAAPAAIGASLVAFAVRSRLPDLSRMRLASLGMTITAVCGLLWYGPLLGVGLIFVSTIGLAASVLNGRETALTYAVLALAFPFGAVGIHLHWLAPPPELSATSWIRVGIAAALFMAAIALVLRRIRARHVALLTANYEVGRALRARTRALVDANKQKAQFMANVTHELRTPLQGVMGLSDLVAKGIYGGVTARHLEAMASIKASARRLLALIDDLLMLASDDAGKLELRLEEVDLLDALPTVLATGQWLLADRDLRLTHEFGALPTITTDRSKLNQIVLNLLANAIKFTPDGGSIVLRARRFGDAIEIEVEDTGIGIPEEELDRIFDEFHQVDGSISREYGGVGLGLTLVKRLLFLLGGTISVTSTVGHGSTFRVRLPQPHRPSSQPHG